MSLAFALAHPHWYPLSGGFSPRSLFAAGEQGAFYDPTDISTLFQDRAGTTPVTALEQPVGLMLDKSKGLVLGPELVANGDFATDTWWTKGTGWVISGGTASRGVSAGFSNLSRAALFTIGKTYRIELDIIAVTGTVTVFCGGSSSVSFTTLGRKSITLTCVGDTAFYIQASTAGTTVTIDNVSVRELPGNHAIQATSTKRPTYSARYNLLQRTEEFDNGAWTKNGLNAFGSGSVANTTATTDPLGGNTADFVQENTALNIHGVQQSWISGGGAHVCTMFFKPAGRDKVEISLDISDAQANAIFYFSGAGSIVFSGTGVTASCVAQANGWYKCAITYNVSSGTKTTRVRSVNAANDGFYSGDGISGLYYWGADLRRTIDTIGMPAYQRVGDGAAGSADYDSAGFFPYLACDGSDDSMATAASVDFTGTDKMTVFSGVTKLSDALRGIVFELGANQNGGIQVNAPSGDTLNNFSFASRGSVFPGQTLADSLIAPQSRVLSGIGDIGADISTLRVNGVATLNNADQGTGNYGNYTLYLAARNNASLFFNGRLYPQIILGRAASQAEIESTERWLRDRMPVSF